MSNLSKMTPSDYFDQMGNDHRRLCEEVKFALLDAIERAGIKTHSVSARVKDKSSYLEKIIRKGYENPLKEVEDIVGVRVVCLFMADLPKLKKIVHDVFTVLKEEDKIEGGATDSFGYMSIHYVCNLHSENSGPRYAGLGAINFEVQCRTILMDAWANVSHYLAYKGEASIPEHLRKDFHALAGLFYVADKHFELFSHDSEGSTVAAANAVVQGDASKQQNLPIDRDTMLALLTHKYPDRQAPTLEMGSEFAQEVTAAGYTTVKAVRADLDAADVAAIAYERDFPPSRIEGRLYSAVGIARQALSIANHTYAAVRYGKAKHDSFEDYRGLLNS